MVVFPRQTERSGPALIFGRGFTFTVTVSFPVQVLLVVVIMYVEVPAAGGVAMGFAMVVLFKPSAGDQRYPVTLEGAVGLPPSVAL